MKRVNNFLALKSLREDYRSYVSTFQKYRNPRIEDWVRKRIESGTLLWQEPLVELNRRFQTAFFFLVAFEVGRNSFVILFFNLGFDTVPG